VSPAAVAAPAHRGRPAGRAAPTQPSPSSRRAHLRLVTPARPARLAPHPIVAAAIGTVVVLLALVVVHVLLAQSQLTLDHLSTKIDNAQSSYEQARLQHAQLAAPSRIIARAGQLGLVPPAQPAVPVPVTGPTAAPAKTPAAVPQP
jgi:cell division protein FtsL